MKKYVLLGVLALLLVALVASVAMAVPPARYDGGNKNQAVADRQRLGKKVLQLYLFEKEPSGLWPIIEGAAWGKMKYNTYGETFDFVFNGHDLEPSTPYALTAHKASEESWPIGVVVLDQGVSDNFGNIHLSNSMGVTESVSDAKIWLLLTGDLMPRPMGVPNTSFQASKWNPTEYLFEHHLIDFTYTGE